MKVKEEMISDEYQGFLNGDSTSNSNLTNNNNNNSRLPLRGFLFFSAATEIYSVVASSLFVPIVLETMARESSFISPAHILPCPSLFITVIRCKVQYGNSWIDPTSYSLYIFALSSILQAIILISISSFADNPIIRHYLMLLFGLIGSIFSILFLFLNSNSWKLAGIFSILTQISLGVNLVCLNSFLPELVKNQLTIQLKEEEIKDGEDQIKVSLREGLTEEDLIEARIELNKCRESLILERERILSKISSISVAVGYASGIIVLLFLLLPVTLMKGSTQSLRLAIGISGLFWGLGMIPAAIWLKPVDFPPISRIRSKKFTLLGSLDFSKNLVIDLAFSWRSLYLMLRDWRRLPSNFTYLCAWFLLSDAFSTITSTAILFAKTSLNMNTSSLIIIAALTPSSGVAGAIFFPRLQKDYLKLSNIQTVSLLVSLALVVPIWAIVALQEQWEMFILAIYFGTIYGSFVAYSRSCYAELIPAGQAARFYSLYSITDKSSSFLGPFLIGIITNLTGEIRNGFFLIVIMLLCSIPILNLVDTHQGRKDAEIYASDGVQLNDRSC